MLALTAASCATRTAGACAKDGRVLAVELTPTTIELDGEPYVFTFVYDIRPLAELEKRFRLMVESSTDGILLTDPLGRIDLPQPGCGALARRRSPASSSARPR